MRYCTTLHQNYGDVPWYPKRYTVLIFHESPLDFSAIRVGRFTFMYFFWMIPLPFPWYKNVWLAGLPPNFVKVIAGFSPFTWSIGQNYLAVIAAEVKERGFGVWEDWVNWYLGHFMTCLKCRDCCVFVSCLCSFLSGTHYRFLISYFIYKGKGVTMSHRFFIACMQYYISRYASMLPFKSIMTWTPSASEPIFGLLIDTWLLWIPYERQHLVVSALLVWVARVSPKSAASWHWNVALPH